MFFVLFTLNSSLWIYLYFIWLNKFLFFDIIISMKNSILRNKSLDFSAHIVNMYEDFLLLKKDNTIAKQLLRSATSIGANINEATFGNSKADFIAKLHIALKECSESLYWLELMSKVNYKIENIDILISECNEIKALLVSSITTAKNQIN